MKTGKAEVQVQVAKYKKNIATKFHMNEDNVYFIFLYITWPVDIFRIPL